MYTLKLSGILLFVHFLCQGQSGLWGLTAAGGLYDRGVIYNTDPDGNNYSVEHNFEYTNGEAPVYTTFLEYAGNLYACTNAGGISGNGCLIKFDPSTNEVQKLYDFVTATGINPQGSLTLGTDGMFYGMTVQGGANNNGTLFQFNPITNVHTVKVDFESTTTGRNCLGSLVAAQNGLLYGYTTNGGANDLGTFFQYDPLTSVHIKLFDFNGATLGSVPFGAMMQAGNGKIYGTTRTGGASGNGTLFEFDPATNTPQRLYSFVTSSGGFPMAGLQETSPGILCGLTSAGGANNLGVLYQFDLSTNTYSILQALTSTTGSPSYSTIHVGPNGLWYLSTSAGAAFNRGALLEYDGATNTFTRIINFDGNNGANPRAGIMLHSNGLMYGLTNAGGVRNAGSIYSFDYTTGSQTLLRSLNYAPLGMTPRANLILGPDGELYGMCQNGGVNGNGTIFKIHPGTKQVTLAASFTAATTGAGPMGDLLLASDGNMYGMTTGGGANSVGVLFRFHPSTNILSTVLSFNTTTGTAPRGSLREVNGFLYGMTFGGGASTYGTIFRVELASDAFSKLFDFDATNGRNPQCSFCLADNGKLYTILNQGGANNTGCILELDPTSLSVTKLADLNSTTGAGTFSGFSRMQDGTLIATVTKTGQNCFLIFSPTTYVYTVSAAMTTALYGTGSFGGVMQASNGKVYATTRIGAANNGGALVEFDPANGTFINKINFTLATGRTPNYNSLLELNPTPLPIRLVSFSAKADGEIHRLSWLLAGDDNRGTLYVEQSCDAAEWKIVHTTEIGRHQTLKQETTFAPDCGNNYYRLKLVSDDGSILYSSLQQVSKKAASIIGTYNITGQTGSNQGVLIEFYSDGSVRKKVYCGDEGN